MTEGAEAGRGIARPAPTLVSKKRRKFSECRPVRARTSATGKKASVCTQTGGGAAVRTRTRAEGGPGRGRRPHRDREVARKVDAQVEALVLDRDERGAVDAERARAAVEVAVEVDVGARRGGRRRRGAPLRSRSGLPRRCCRREADEVLLSRERGAGGRGRAREAKVVRERARLERAACGRAGGVGRG